MREAVKREISGILRCRLAELQGGLESSRIDSDSNSDSFAAAGSDSATALLWKKTLVAELKAPVCVEDYIVISDSDVSSGSDEDDENDGPWDTVIGQSTDACYVKYTQEKASTNWELPVNQESKQQDDAPTIVEPTSTSAPSPAPKPGPHCAKRGIVGFFVDAIMNDHVGRGVMTALTIWFAAFGLYAIALVA
jgi:hypothetical protein